MTINEPQTLEQVQTEVGDLPPADLPMALLPVRLETRFVELEEAHALCVRIFPDELHVETHETGMTRDEERWGKHLWRQAWRSGGEEAAQRALRDDLAARFGPGRADWIARKLQPLNQEERPDEPVAASDPLPNDPTFPDVPRQEEAWTRPPLAHAMPDRWVVLGYRENRRVLTALGRKIPERLQAGPDPQAPPPDDARDDVLTVEDGMHWMVDFERAVQDGMGLRIPISTSEAEAGYDRLIVLGARSQNDGEVGSAELEALLEAQRYTDSLAFVPQGTPSNNTAEAKSGYGGSEPERWSAFLSRDGAGVAAERSNRIVTAEALGLQPSVFDHIPHANEAEQADARAFNTAFWPASWGYFLRFILLGALTDDRLDRARRHFADFVRGRGPLPVLRVGRQPYGILPITVLDRYVPADDEAFGHRGLETLRALRARWETMASRSPHARAVRRQEEMEQSLADILGRGAVTDHVVGRMAVDGALYGLRPVNGLEAEPGEELQERKRKAMAWLRELGVGVEVPGASLLFTDHVLRMEGGLAAAGERPPVGPLDPNYISAIRGATVSELLADAAGTGDESTLLYRLLRHAVLLAYVEAAYRIQVAEGLIEPGVLGDPALVDVVSTSGDGSSDESGEGERTLTPLRLLDAVVPAVDEAPLREVMHKLGASAHREAALLDEMRKSLDHLASVPPPGLDALLREALDLATYRLDAWITSLATARLHRLRQDRPVGLLLGGFGWVEDLRMAGTRSRVTSGVPDEELDEEANGPLFELENSGGYVATPSLTQASATAVLRSGYLAYANGSSSAPFAIDLASDRVRLAEWLLDGVRAGQPLSALLGYRFERSLRENDLARYIQPFRLVAPFGELYEAMAQKASLQDEMSALEKRHEEERAARLKDIQSLNDRIDRKESQQASLSSKSGGISGQIVKLNNEMADLKKQRNRLQEQLERIPAHKEELINELLANINGLNFQIKKKRERIDELKADRSSLQKQISAVKDEIKSLESQRSARQNALKELEQEFRDAITERKAEIEQVQKLIDDLEAAQRKKYTATSSLQAMESIEVQHVVDGMVLVRKWEAGALPFGQKGLPKAGSAEAGALGDLLDALAATADAVGDLVTAESVFQLTKGNVLRAGATLDAVARGETPPPEAELVRTPRRMSAHTHRIAVLLGGDAEAPAGWTTDSFQQRAPAEPALNAWIARLLPDPDRVRIEATFRDAATGDSLASASSRLGNFQLSPLDAVFLAGETGTALKALLTFRLLRNPPQGVAPGARVTFDLSRGEDWPADHVSFGEFVEVARAALELITEARPLDARDLTRPEAGASPNVDHADMEERANAAATHLRNAREKLATEIEAHETSDRELDPLRTAIFRLFWMGLPEAVPQRATGDEPEEREILLDQARAVLEEADLRLEELDAADARRAESTPEGKLALDVERLRVVFGKDFSVLPKFEAAEADALEATLADSRRLQGDDPLAAVDWFQQVAHVRPGAARLNTSLTYAEALSAEAGMDFTVGQLPRRENDRWIALPFESEEDASLPRVSLVVQLTDGFAPGRPAAGLLMDEWVEAVPASHETAGVAFHFDAPAAEAPQSILLAVPPGDRPAWDLETLEAVVQETVLQTKLRTVDAAAIADDDEYGQFLPALYLAFNPAGDTVSTDLAQNGEE